MHPGGKKLVCCRLEDHNTDYELSEMAAQGSGPRTDDRMRRRRNDVMLPSRLAGSPRATLQASVTSLSTGCHSGHEGFENCFVPGGKHVGICEGSCRMSHQSSSQHSLLGWSVYVLQAGTVKGASYESIDFICTVPRPLQQMSKLPLCLIFIS